MKGSNRSKYLAGACSAALLATWAGQGLAQSEQQSQDRQSQGSPSQKDQKQMQGEQQRTSSAHGAQAVIESAGQPTNVLVVGKVTDARDVTLAGTAGDKHRLLKVQPNAGKEVVVDIGVRQGTAGGMELKKGDRIVAMGKPARINGRPVLFAASVAEMQRVNLSSEDSKQNQSRSGVGNKDSASANRTQGAGEGSPKQANRQASQQRPADYDAIYLFDTSNYAKDEYGIYDEDFVWTTSDATYDTWNDTARAWEDTERAHYDMFGYDDAGETGLWDW